MRTSRYLATIAFVAVMFTASELSGIDMIIFPEMLALLTGMLCTDRFPWKTDNLHTVILMTLSAAIGVIIANTAPFGLYFQALTGFFLVALLLMLSDCSLMPSIAACLFPIYFKESSSVYPIAVAAMTIIVLIIRGRFIRKGKIEASVKFRYLPDFEVDLKMWGMVLAAFALLSALPLLTGYIFFAAPPLVVTLAESSSKNLKGKRIKIWFVITVAAVIGAILRFSVVDMLGISAVVAATAAAALTLVEMRLMNMLFPPAGAIAILAFVAEGNIFFYPPMISAGAAIILAASAWINNRMEQE